MVTFVGNSALSDANVEITYSGADVHIPRTIAIKLTADDHFRQNVYLMPEHYRVVATSREGNKQVLAQTDFVVDRTAPVRVDLGKAYSEGSD